MADRGNHELVMDAVKRNGMALEFASSRLKGDQEVVRAAVINDSDAFKFAATTLRSSSTFVMSLLKESLPAGGESRLLAFGMGGLNADRRVVMAAVTKIFI